MVRRVFSSDAKARKLLTAVTCFGRALVGGRTVCVLVVTCIDARCTVAMFPSPSHTEARGPDLAQAEQLLRDLATISFRDTAHVKTVEYTLSALADWRPESQAGSEALAVRWVERIYAVRDLCLLEGAGALRRSAGA
jgi:hypothetical protein